MSIREVIEYELHCQWDSLKRTDTWMYIVSFFAIVFALLNKTVFLIICLLALIILQGKHDVESGKVKHFQREKYKKNLEGGVDNANKEQEGNAVEQAQ